MKAKVYADGTRYTYAYDHSGRLVSIVDPMGRTKSLEFDTDDTLVELDYSDPNTPDVTYSYDAFYRRLTSRLDGIGTTTFSYHPHDESTFGAGQLATSDGPFTDDTLRYTYDALGRVAKMEIVDDVTTSSASYSEAYTYDSRGRVIEVDNDLGVFDYTYDGQTSRVEHIDYPNGMKVEYDYFGNPVDRLLKQIKNLSSGPSPAVISQFDYTYNPDRTIDTWRIEQGGQASTWTFGYDEAQQLTDAVRRGLSGTVIEEE